VLEEEVEVRSAAMCRSPLDVPLPARKAMDVGAESYVQITLRAGA